MIVALEAPGGDGPADKRRAARRSHDAWNAGADGLTIVGADDPRAEARLVLHEPEALVPEGVLARVAAALASSPRAGRFLPEGFFACSLRSPEIYSTVWELDELAAAEPPGPPRGAPAGAAPVSLVRDAEAETLAVPGWLVHSFAGRRRHDRPEVAALVPAFAGRILEIGCAEGGLGAALERRGARVTGVEPDPEAARVAAGRLSRVVNLPLEAAWGELRETFDAVILADLLEHLEDPVAALHELAERSRPGGCLVASLPNGSHATVLAGALGGRWDPALEGIVADDHRTYAGRRGWTRLLAAGGWEVERWVPVLSLAPRVEPWLAVLAPAGLDEEELRAVQWLCVARARPSTAGDVTLGPAETSVPFSLDPDDPLGDVRDRLSREETIVCELPNAVFWRHLEPLLTGDLVAGPGRRALVRAATSHGLAARFRRSAIAVSVEARETEPPGPAVEAVLGRARLAGLRVAPGALGHAALRATFRLEPA